MKENVKNVKMVIHLMILIENVLYVKMMNILMVHIVLNVIQQVNIVLNAQK